MIGKMIVQPIESAIFVAVVLFLSVGTYWRNRFWNDDIGLWTENLGQIYWHEFQNRQKAIYHLKPASMLDPFLMNRSRIRKLVQTLEGIS